MLRLPQRHKAAIEMFPVLSVNQRGQELLRPFADCQRQLPIGIPCNAVHNQEVQ
jgi:hypothetical protein